MNTHGSIRTDSKVQPYKDKIALVERILRAKEEEKVAGNDILLALS